MGGLIKVAEINEIPIGQSKLVEVEGHRIALFNIEQKIFAIADSCTHQGGALSEGTIEGSEVTCPLHRARFDVKTGEALGPPATKGVQRFNVKVEESDIKIEIP